MNEQMTVGVGDRVKLGDGTLVTVKRAEAGRLWVKRGDAEGWTARENVWMVVRKQTARGRA